VAEPSEEEDEYEEEEEEKKKKVAADQYGEDEEEEAEQEEVYGPAAPAARARSGYGKKSTPRTKGRGGGAAETSRPKAEEGQGSGCDRIARRHDSRGRRQEEEEDEEEECRDGFHGIRGQHEEPHGQAVNHCNSHTSDCASDCTAQRQPRMTLNSSILSVIGR
jgi:hypothetical protein